MTDEKKMRLAENNRRWREKNREKFNEYHRNYYREHKDTINARRAEQYQRAKEDDR